jgi:hypothetical protein
MINPTPRRLARALTLVVVAAALSLQLGGCMVAGVLAYKVMGPPPIPPRFVPTREKPLLVMVENSHATHGSVPEADELTQVLRDELKDNLYKDMKEGKDQPPIGHLVDPSSVHQLRAADPEAFKRMTVSEIGKNVGAAQIIYVTLNELAFDLPPGGEMLRLRITAAVRVVDTQTAQTVWPDSGPGEQFHYQSPYKRITAEDNEYTLRREVLRQAGTEIARWFFPYKPETMGEENQDMRLR